MPPDPHPDQALRLIPADGPELAHLEVPAARFATIGRAADCQVYLPHEAVSRRHATVSSRFGRWSITDLSSRHGTFLNGVRLASSAPAELADGDMLKIGPWTLRVGLGPAASGGVTMADGGRAAGRVERISERELEWATRQRLNLLIECSAAINAAGSEHELVLAALDAAVAGSGYRRAAWIRLAGPEGQIEVLGARTPTAEAGPEFVFSRSLIREAARGGLSRLIQGEPVNFGQSIESLNIHSALCAPIVMGSATVGFLYFDARGEESAAHVEAAGFCQAIARMCGLAMSHLKRADLERRQQRTESELAAAREAQQFIMPPAAAELCGLRYASRTRPGHTVAGDLFDVVALPGDRVAVVLGDVTGDGIGAGILMATTQSYLHAALTRYNDAALALIALNEYLCSRSAMNRFVTMWVGIIEPRAGLVHYVDAGHGHWLFKPRGGSPFRPDSLGGIPVAIEPDYEYSARTLEIGPGDRILLYSDGLSEQRSPSGEEFGSGRVIASLAHDAGVDRDVQALFDAVSGFACTDMLNDDATAASIELIIS